MLHVSHLVCPLGRAEEQSASINSPVFARSGAFWNCGHLLSFNPKYPGVISPDKSQRSPFQWRLSLLLPQRLQKELHALGFQETLKLARGHLGHQSIIASPC